MSGSGSPFSPPFFHRFRTSKEKSLVIRNLRVTTVPGGDSLRCGVSGATHFAITRHFSSRTSSPTFSHINDEYSLALR